jgi:hypothetical protein
MPSKFTTTKRTAPKKVASPVVKKVQVVSRGKAARKGALVRLTSTLKKRLDLKLAEQGRKFQDVAVELITRYVDGDTADATDFQQQVKAARESIRKNAVALRELAK